MKIILLLIVVSLLSCSQKSDLLTDRDWILFSESNIDGTKRYTADQKPMTFRFNLDGTFFYSENGVPKGEEVLNRWELDGNKLTLNWSGVWVNQLNELIVDKLDKDWLYLKNDNSGQLISPSFIFYPKGSPLEKIRGVVE